MLLIADPSGQLSVDDSNQQGGIIVFFGRNTKDIS